VKLYNIDDNELINMEQFVEQKLAGETEVLR
jgi:hypothetical protein